MNVVNVRLHLRILRRLSMATLDSVSPVYEDSALFFWDRNETHWGRLGVQVGVQENPRAFDSFCSAITSPSMLRLVSETFHHMLLRGFTTKVTSRDVTDLAKSIAIGCKIPRALIDRYPLHNDHLQVFRSLRSFHDKFPVGMRFDGSSVPDGEKCDYPIHSSDCVDTMVTTILIPLHTNKKLSSLSGATDPLGVGFVKDALPTLDSFYAADAATQTTVTKNKNVQRNPSDPSDDASFPSLAATTVSDAEAKALKKTYEESTVRITNDIATEYLANQIIFFHWDTPSLSDKIAMQPMLSDGNPSLWFFNAGTDATKDPAARSNYIKMRGQPIEEHATFMLNLSARMLTALDTAVVISGRNNAFYSWVKKEVIAMKPRVGMRDLFMEPDDDELLQCIRAERSLVGSVERRDAYIQFVKTPAVLKGKRGQERRFTGGHTAMKGMTNLPILKKDAMISVPIQERELTFRNVTPSDKFSQVKRKQQDGPGDGGDHSSSGEEAEDGDASVTPSVIDPKASVVYFWMEMHPKVLMLADSELGRSPPILKETLHRWPRSSYGRRMPGRSSTSRQVRGHSCVLGS